MGIPFAVINLRIRESVLLIILMTGFTAASAASTEVVVSGSTTVGPLGILWAEAFNAGQSNYHVSVSQTGTGAGITAIAGEKSDIAMASREVTDVEKARYGNKFQETLVGYDGIAVCVSKAIYDAGVKALAKEQVKEIYAGNITNWKQLGGPDEEIYAVSREQGSGTRETFLTDIFGTTAAETPAVRTYATSSSEIKTAITRSDNAIGYLGYSYSETGNLNAVSLDGVGISVQTIKDGTYPLARRLYLDTLGDPKPGAKAFMDFAVSPDGRKIAVENGFIPVQGSAISANLTIEQGKSESPEKKQPGFELTFALTALFGVSCFLRRSGR
jgi:phosphate transport system substrate-binding protein